MRALLFLLSAFVLAGCRGRSEADLVGSWTSSKGSSFEIEPKGAYTVMAKGPTKTTPEAGTWSMQGDRVTLTLTTINGAPIRDLKARLEARAATLTPRLRAIAANLGQPETFKLSEDGKTLTKVSPPTKTPYTLVRA